jgi:hypothetical protein
MDKEDEPSSLPAVVRSEEVDEFARFYDVSRLDSVKRSPRRTNNAVHDAFDLIGGVPRLAVWADKNPGEFFTKLLPKTLQTHQQQEHSGVITIVSKVPRTAIDGEYTDVTPEASGDA